MHGPTRSFWGSLTPPSPQIERLEAGEAALQHALKEETGARAAEGLDAARKGAHLQELAGRLEAQAVKAGALGPAPR
jgi:hypothetical protein